MTILLELILPTLKGLNKSSRRTPHKKCYIIDEVQKAPALLDSIHSLIEEYKTHQFILTGSSARKLRRGGVNLLAGRALLTHFHPFMAAELGNDFSLDTALRNGLIPLIVSANKPGQDSGDLRCPIPEGRSQRRGVGKRHRRLCPFSGSHQLFSRQYFKSQQYRQRMPCITKDCRKLSVDY